MASGSGGRWGCRKEHPFTSLDLETAHGLKCLRYVRVTGQISGVNWATTNKLGSQLTTRLL